MASRRVWIAAPLTLAMASGCARAERPAAPQTSGDTMRPAELDPAAALAAIKAADPDFGHIAARHPREFTPLETPFLDRTRVVRMDVLTPERPLFAHYALSGEQAVRVTADAAAFDGAVAADGAGIEDAAEALSLVAARIAATRAAGTRARLVRGVADLPWMPKVEGAAAERKAAVSKRVAATPPSVSAAEAGWLVDGWVLDGRALVWTRFSVSPRGAVKAESGERLDGLPFTYAH